MLWQINYMLFQEINNHAGKFVWFDNLMIFCANTLIFCWPILLLMVWGIPFQWRKRPAGDGEAELVAERRAVVIWAAVACLLAYGINLCIEQFIFEPRPFISHKVHVLISHVADASFPSDHTAWSFAVFGMLLFALLPFASSRRRASHSVDGKLLGIPVLLLVIALVMAVSVGFARVYAGVHYPDDVLGGAIDGLVAAFFVTLLRQWLQRPTNAVLHFVGILHLT